LLGFAAFLRYEEIAKLNCNDVAFFTNHVEIKIRSSKNDRLRQGDCVLVARSGKLTCPVAILERYMAMGGLSSSSGILFRPLSRGVSSYVLQGSCHTLICENCCWIGWNLLATLNLILEITAFNQEVPQL